MADGFLSRWSRRKQGRGSEVDDARSGQDAPPPAKPVTSAEPPPAKPIIAAQAATQAKTAVVLQQPGALPLDAEAGQDAHPAVPAGDQDTRALTLEDVKALTPESDFSAFTARHVAPDVRNAAMKKLFADPHYNIMDRLDIYIDDYSKPDPIPAAMLRQLASAKFLKLFDEEETDEAGAGGPTAVPRLEGSMDIADDPVGQTVAHSTSAPQAPSNALLEADPAALPLPQPKTRADLSLPDHADTDLRLQ